jgi:hypothetical protein
VRSKVISIDAPVEGWNAFDGLDNMPPAAAIILDNLIPGAGHVDTREGYLEYYDLQTGVPCHTVASFNSNDKSRLVAASGGGLWDITDTEVGFQANAVEELAPVGTFSNDKWQHRNFRKADEEGVLIMCNGVDSTQIISQVDAPPPDLETNDLIANDGTLPWTYQWTRIADDDVTLPSVGEWNMNVAQNLLRINLTDNGATDRYDDLIELKVDSEMTLVDALDPNQSMKIRITGEPQFETGTDFVAYPIFIMETGLGYPTQGLLQDITAFNGLVDTNFIGVEVFKGRCYYWYDNDDAFYYTNAGAYQGEMHRFPLGAFIQLGGKLLMVTTWTQQDSGDGKDDFIVFIFSTGEMLIYQGDDPGGIGFFEMVGRYNTAEPLSIRSKAKYGSDIIVGTKDGYIGLSSVIQQGRTSDVPQFSRLIHTAITDQVAQTANIYGWDQVLFPKKGLMVFNVPITPDTFNQYVLNTVTQRWCRFKGLNVNCLEVHEERLFGGTNDGKVYALLETTADNGAPIEFTCLYAFNYLGDPGVQKHVTAAQVMTTHSAPEYIQLTGYADYDVPVITPVFLPAEATLGTWSINPEVPPAALGSFWDADFWARSGTPFTYKGWQNLSAFGFSCSMLVRFAKLNEGVRWRSTNLRYYLAGSQ